MNRCTYLLPLRRAFFDATEAARLRDYFTVVGDAGCEVLVIDGSADGVFARHHEFWSGVCRHQRVDARFTFLNDKVNGIHTGVELARSSKIILADDDIRYTPIDIERTCGWLEDFDVVRPQNYLSPQPWWARLEGARMLINRATLRAADYPGTCAFRREIMLRAGSYDGDVLFDNEEIIRHFARTGARLAYANDFFVRKRPPRLRKWLEQRPRQAYEDFGLRTKTALFAALLPCALLMVILAGPAWLIAYLLGVATVSILLALAGWSRGPARAFFSLSTILFAPAWILERSLSTYWAFFWYFLKGGYPFGDRLLRKGIGRDWVEGGRLASRMVVSLPPGK